MIVSGGQWRDSAMHIHVSILPQAPLPSRLPQNFAQCYMAAWMGGDFGGEWIFGWVPSLSTWNYHNIVNQLYSNIKSESESRSVASNSLQPHGLQPTRLLSPWNSLGKNTGVGSHSLLQGIFPTQGSNPGLPHCRQILYHPSPGGSDGSLIKTSN